ncbi:MAG: hypothetical protein HRT58_14675 [Crocinitomicaceae bacterium]|nr:hypothetical protein [Flavobacteriales bacterium]NQZ36912.1 hypothetical protein [Crocinitomicaceae bacterium]
MNYELFFYLLWWISILLLAGGLSFNLIRRGSKKNHLLIIYLFAIALLEGTSQYLSEYHKDEVNIYLFHFSGFLHFFFVVLWYHHYFKLTKRIKHLIILLVGTLFFFGNITPYGEILHFQIYANVLYNLVILSLGLSYYIQITLHGQRPDRHEHFFNIALLLYFSFDAIISISSNYLINEHLDLVAPFWLFRALLLQLFYLSLINSAWQVGKIPK